MLDTWAESQTAIELKGFNINATTFEFTLKDIIGIDVAVTVPTIAVPTSW